jgi:hypothetical protein
MNAGILPRSRRWLLTLVVAALLAVGAAYSPVLLDGLAGTDLNPTAAACQGPGSGCG